MIDWTREMTQEFSFWEMDPATWLDVAPIGTVASCSVTRDADSETLESATLEIDGRSMGESWIRAYMECEQDGERHRECMGTWLVQTPRRSFDGRVSTLDVTAYSALHPTREALCPLGTSAPVGGNCAELAAAALSDHGPAPVEASESRLLLVSPYVADAGASWLEYSRALASMAGMGVSVNPNGIVSVSPSVPVTAVMPSFELSDGNSSVLMPEASETLDWYGLPNVCEVVVSNGGLTVAARAVNDDPASPISTESRGREVTLRVESPEELAGGASYEECLAIARMKLAEASCVEREIEVTYGYRPSALGQCVRVDYSAAGISGDARIVRQEMDLERGLLVRATLSVKQEMWSV